MDVLKAIGDLALTVDLSQVLMSVQGGCVLFCMWLCSQIMAALEGCQHDITAVNKKTDWLFEEMNDQGLTTDMRLTGLEARIAKIESSARPAAPKAEKSKPKAKPKPKTLKIA